MNRYKYFIACGVTALFLMLSSTLKAQNAYTRLCLKAVEFEKTGNLQEAVNTYTEAINLKPDEWTGYSYRAKVLLQTRKYDEAISDISKAITLSPQTLSLYAVRANCYQAKGEHEKAIADFNMALSGSGNKDKSAYITYSQRGSSYHSNKQYYEAITDYTKAIELGQSYANNLPGKPDSYRNLLTGIYGLRAKSNISLNRFSEAIKDLDTYLADKTDDIEANVLQGYSYLKNGNKEKAGELAQKILRLDPSLQIYFSGDRMMDIFNLEERRDKSRQLTEAAMAMIAEQKSIPSKTLANIKITDAFNNLDTAWFYSPSISDEDKKLRGTILENLFLTYPLLRTKPEIPEVTRKYSVQASNATQEKKYNDAIKLWSDALGITPHYPLAYYNRSLLYERIGNYRAGIEDMGKYLKLMPDASDARSAKDKIYEWEAKVKDVPTPTYKPSASAINTIETGSYYPGNYHFAIAFGGSFGFQVAKNPSLADLWAQTKPASVEYKYTDKLPFLYSGDIEIVGKPLKRFGIGIFGKLSGGIGCKTKVSEVKYMLNMGALQYGGLARYYFMLNNLGNKPDLYFQYAYGRSKLSGYYGVATMDGIIFDYSFMNHYDSSAPYHSPGVGMGGKIGKHGYLTLSLDYMYSAFDKITWEITTDKSNPGNVGTKGTLVNTSTGENITAKYNGILFKLLFGVCF